MSMVPSRSGRVASTLELKRRGVTTVRDFPSGCRRVTAPNFGLSRQITVDQGFGDRGFLVLYVIRPIKC
ncbi:hypothetical protein PVK06_020372 [Gossypium arboreum]|uniref:Uncharacterized protein n=1 Tax=Gossypium arboreum TaxID=29729 RepID=A0ABR0PMB4_GOSAR|nr:hypothetical protein PVK06_020372 [Gossypium arboreum]